MRHVLAVVLALVTLSFAQPEQVKKAHATTHEISMQAITGGAGCSATAVARHALLTASHCEVPTDTVEIDGEDANIVGIVRDGNDHSILLVDATFKDYSDFSDRSMEQGDTVFVFGNPGGLTDIMRFGIFSGIKRQGLFGLGTPMLLFDINVFHGDSGAAMFDAVTGGITTVVTGTLLLSASDTDSIRVTVAYPLAFTKEQLEQVRSF